MQQVYGNTNLTFIDDFKNPRLSPSFHSNDHLVDRRHCVSDREFSDSRRRCSTFPSPRLERVVRQGLECRRVPGLWFVNSRSRVDWRQRHFRLMLPQEFGSIDCQHCMLSSSVCPRRQKARHSLRREPEKHLAVQESVPFRGCHSLEALPQCVFAHRLLVPDDRRIVPSTSDRDRLRTAATFNQPSFFAVDAVHIQKRGSAQESVFTYRLPGSSLRHVIQAWVMQRKVFSCDTQWITRTSDQ